MKGVRVRSDVTTYGAVQLPGATSAANHWDQVVMGELTQPCTDSILDSPSSV